MPARALVLALVLAGCRSAEPLRQACAEARPGVPLERVQPRLDAAGRPWVMATGDRVWSRDHGLFRVTDCRVSVDGGVVEAARLEEHHDLL